MKMNITLIKQMGIFSALIGAFVGIVTLIPLIGNIVYTIFYIALSAILIVYLKKIDILGDITMKEGGILGAVIGVVSNIAFLCVYLPIITIIQLLFGNGWIGQMIVACFSSFLSFLCLIFMIIFVVLLSALMNGFAGAAIVYIYELLAKLKNEG